MLIAAGTAVPTRRPSTQRRTDVPSYAPTTMCQAPSQIPVPASAERV